MRWKIGLLLFVLQIQINEYANKKNSFCNAYPRIRATKRGRLNVHCVGSFYSNRILFLVMFLRVPSIDSTCFFAYVGFIGDWFFLLSTDSTYLRVPGDKEKSFFFRLTNFFRCSFYIQIGVLQFASPVQFYAKSSNFYTKLNVSNLYVTNLYQF